MSKSMLNPPEREQYVKGGLKNIIEFGAKVIKPLNEGQKKVEKATQKQAVTAKAQAKAFGYGALTISLGDLLYSNISEDEVPSLMKKAEAANIPFRVVDERINPEDYPVYKKDSESAKAFRQAQRNAKKAGADFFEYEGRSYNTREKNSNGSRQYDPVQGYKEMYKTLERSLENAETEEQRKTIEKNFLKDTGNVPGTTVRDAMMELEEEGFFNREAKAKGGLPDLTGDGEITQADVLKGRGVFNEGGSMMMPPEGMPVDTYPNIPEDEMDEALASQLPDDEMEDDYISYVMDESLDDDEQDYLAGVLQNDPRLSDILDKVITVASEFSGAGEVEGPGTGVSDSIPARLSDGEFVFTRKATDQIGADQLQTMMDDAERAYDGGYQMKAIGGYMQEDPEEQDSPLSQTDEEIKKLMMGANKMPSLR